MKQFLLVFLTFFASVLYGQDLTIDSVAFSKGIKVWNVTTPADQNCAIQMGYSALSSKSQMLISTIHVVNMSDVAAAFPQSSVWWNPCREKFEILNLYGLQVLDKDGQIVYANNFSGELFDDQRWKYWYEPTCDASNVPTFADQNFVLTKPYDSCSNFGLSPGFWHESNPFPSGYRIGVDYSYINKPGNYTFKFWINDILNQKDKCFTDTIRPMFKIDTVGGLSIAPISTITGKVPNPINKCDTLSIQVPVNVTAENVGKGKTNTINVTWEGNAESYEVYSAVTTKAGNTFSTKTAVLIGSTTSNSITDNAPSQAQIISALGLPKGTQVFLEYTIKPTGSCSSGVATSIPSNKIPLK